MSHGTPIERAAAIERLVAAHDHAVGTIEALAELDDAYAVQEQVAERLAVAWAGPVRGYKLGLTLADPPPTGLASAPAYGRLLERSLLADGATVSVVGAPLVECELLFRAVEALAPDLDDATLLARTEVAAMIEVPRSRFVDWWPVGGAPRLTREEFIADSCAAGQVVVGATWVPGRSMVPADVAVELDTPGGDTVIGHGAAVMGDPLTALRWFLDRRGALAPHEVVATGTLTPAQHAVAGTYLARFPPPLGEVSVSFA